MSTWKGFLLSPTNNGIYMFFFTFVIALFSSPVNPPTASVVCSDFDAVWVPEGVTGFIVAAPFDEQVF